MLAVRYQALGREMWDNNMGDNYKAQFEVIPPALSPVKVPVAIEGLPSTNGGEAESDVAIHSPSVSSSSVANIIGSTVATFSDKEKDTKVVEERSGGKIINGIKKPEQRDPLASRYDFAASFKEKGVWKSSLDWSTTNVTSVNVNNMQSLKTQQLAKINLNKWRSSVPWPAHDGSSEFSASGHTLTHANDHARSQSYSGHQLVNNLHYGSRSHSQAGPHPSAALPSTSNELVGTKKTRVDFLYDPHERRIRGSPRDMYLDDNHSGGYNPPAGLKSHNAGGYVYPQNTSPDGNISGRLKQRSYFDAWA